MNMNEEMLKAAAEEVSDCLLVSADASQLEEHAFSPKFEKKMDRLLRKKEFPWYRVGVAVAAVLALIALVVCATLSSAMDVRAGEDEVVNSVLHGYIRSGRTEDCRLDDLPEYELSYIPEGYSLEKVSQIADEVVCRYGCGNQAYLRLSYVGVSENPDHISYDSSVKYISVPFKNTRAHLYLNENRYGNSSIVWTDPDTNILFEISFRGSREELLRLAYSVREKEK